MWLLPSAILILTCAAFLLKERGALIVGGMLLGNWCLNTSIVYVSGISLPWPLFMAVDYITAILVLHPHTRLTKWQVSVALIYGVQMISHCAYGLSDHSAWPQYRYFYQLLYLAWAQCVIVGVWLGAGSIRRAMRSSGGNRGLQHIRAITDGMGEKHDGASR